MPKAGPDYQSGFLTPAGSFYEVTRGRPYQLDAEARRAAGLVPETWRLEIVGDEPPWRPEIARPLEKSAGTALRLEDLEALYRVRPVRSVKTMQCLMDRPASGLCSNGFWEGVALRDVLALVGRIRNVRRLFYTGYFTEPRHRFASSLSLSAALEAPPGQVPVFLALRLNGRPLPIERGGPVRMIVPNAYGFKSIKWLNRIVLTNDYRANDTYAERQNNDPDSPLKTLARLDVYQKQAHRAGEPVEVRGVAIIGASGLKRVEYWLRPDQGTHGVLDPDDPAWSSAEWHPAEVAASPPPDWAALLPDRRFPDGVLLFESPDRPRVWPLPNSWVPWRVRLEGLQAGAYELRVRAVDLNGFAQPEPRPNPQSGIAEVPCLTLAVT